MSPPITITCFDLYKHFHENPELSFREKAKFRGAICVAELKQLGFTVTERRRRRLDERRRRKKTPVQVLDGVGGYGVVAVLENGEGPTVMLRADMDALPLEEKTGLPYASKSDAGGLFRQGSAGDARLRP